MSAKSSNPGESVSSTGLSREQRRAIHESARRPDTISDWLALGRDWFEENILVILAALVAILVVWGGISGWKYIEYRKERAAQEAFFAVDEKFAKKQAEFERGSNPLFALQGGGEGAKAVKTGKLETDYGDLINGFEKVAEEHRGSVAGAQAAIFAMDVLLEYKEPARALELGRNQRGVLNRSHPLSGLLVLMTGTAEADSGDCKAATATWGSIFGEPAWQHLEAEAALRSGVCFEKLGDLDQAKKKYQMASAAKDSRTVGESAKTFLRALEMKSK
jgi:predicted negative regulator of RcsB-dependent stress response